jgi:hypothetical protein
MPCCADQCHAVLRCPALAATHPQALQRVPLFAGLDPKVKGAIASALGQVSMLKGTAVVTQVRLSQVEGIFLGLEFTKAAEHVCQCTAH